VPQYGIAGSAGSPFFGCGRGSGSPGFRQIGVGTVVVVSVTVVVVSGTVVVVLVVSGTVLVVVVSGTVVVVSGTVVVVSGTVVVVVVVGISVLQTIQ